jgi:hypothetical protein
MTTKFKVLSALPVVLGLACGGNGIKTTQRPDAQVTTTEKSDGQVTTCSYGGKTYNPGDSFRDDCNTCSCGANGQVACTLIGCPTDAGSGLAPDAALPDAQADGTVPIDQAKDVKPAIDVADALTDLSPDLPLAADSAKDALLVADTAKDGQLVVDAEDVGADARQHCVAGGDMLLAIGQSIPKGDGCNTCTCYLTGMACTTSTCDPTPDAAAPLCSLWSPLTFGYEGGMVAYQDSYSLDGGANMTITRTYTLRAGVDGPQVRSCSPTLPACGAPGVVSMSTIAQDLTDPTVQIVLRLTSSTTYGDDRTIMDAPVWSITRAGGGKILVGYPCPVPATEWCQPIPPGIQRLADDLKSLASDMKATPDCAGL